MISRIFAVRNCLINALLAITLGLLSYYALDVWHASRLSELPDHDYYAEIIDLQKQGKTGEALANCHYVQSQQNMPNRDAIVALGAQIEHDQASWLGKCSRFASGFFTGKMNSSEAMVGTVVSDFLVIGDLRDLGYQGYSAATGQEVDAMIVTLSSLGVMASAAAWIPEPGEPAIAGGDIGISLLKGLRKINAITNRFARESMELAKDALKTRKLGRVGEIAEHLGSIAKRTPAGTMGTAMKNVDTLEDLKAISHWTQVAPNETIAALSLSGREAAGWLKSTRSATGKLLGQTLRKGAAGFSKTRPFLRGGKVLYRGRMNEIREPLVDWFIDHAGARKSLFWGGLCCLVLSGMFLISATVHFYRAFRGFIPTPSKSIP